MLFLLIGLRFYFWKHFVSLDIYSFERSNTSFFLLLLAVGLISVGGYLVNDLFDVDVDKVNKPEKELAYSKSILWIIYFVVNIVAVVTTFIIAENTLAILILCSSIILLFLYSYFFQKLPLIGNLVVAILAGFLPILYFSFDSLIFKKEAHFSLPFLTSYLITTYFLIGFGISLLREFVKDIEDIEGDKKSNYKTFPVLVGIKRSKILFYFFSILFIIGTLLIDFYSEVSFLITNYIFYLPTFTLLLISIYQVYQSNFSKSSLFLKGALFSGVLILFIL
jgi:4-hydroxybenzoate polyprenyltransferase